MLNTPALEQAIQEAFDFDSEVDVNPAEARARQARKIANAIEAFVKSGEVNTNVTGASATGGAVQGVGKGNIT